MSWIGRDTIGRLDGRDRRASWRSDEDVDGGGSAVRERELALAAAEVTYGGKLMPPLDRVGGYGAEQDFVQHGAVDLGADVLGILGLVGLQREEEVALRVVHAGDICLGTRDVCKGLAETVLAQSALTVVVPDVNRANVAAGLLARPALVDSERYAAAVESESKSEVSRTSTNSSDTRVSDHAHLCPSCFRQLSVND